MKRLARLPYAKLCFSLTSIALQRSHSIQRSNPVCCGKDCCSHEGGVWRLRHFSRSVRPPTKIPSLVSFSWYFDYSHDVYVSRGDFQFKRTRIEAKEIYDNVKDILPEGRPLFIATDERDKSFFDPLKQHYKIRFLDDYKHLLEGVNT